MDVRDDAAARDGGLDERVQLLVAADGQLQVARGDALHLRSRRGERGASDMRARGVLLAGGQRQRQWQLKQPRKRDACLQVLRRIASQLQHLGCEVLCGESGAVSVSQVGREAHEKP